MILSIKKIYVYQFTHFSMNLVSLLLGFYLSTILSTLPAQTGDWNIINASIIVTINETFSKFFYSFYKQRKPIVIDIMNSIKIGIIYGLFVDAFKLGS